MHAAYDELAPKRPTNLSLNSDLLRQAKALDINLSATLEHALSETVRDKKRALWLANNLDAIATYNQLVEEQGVFSDGLRSF